MTGRKIFSLILVLVLVASSLPVFLGVNTQASSGLSTPEFSLTYIDNSYDVKPTYGINDFTGQSEMKTSGYHVQNWSMVVKIKNPSFSTYKIDGKTVNLYYSISVKGHYGDSWRYYTDYYSHYGEYTTTTYISAKENDLYTIVVFGFFSNNGSYQINQPLLADVDTKGELDFRVQAYEAYFTKVENEWLPVPGWPQYTNEITVVETSAWSGIQTINLSEGTTITQPSISPQPTSTRIPTETASPMPTTTLAQPDTQTSILPQLSWEQTAILVLVGVVGVLLAGLVVLWRKVTHISKANRQSEPPPPT